MSLDLREQLLAVFSDPTLTALAIKGPVSLVEHLMAEYGSTSLPEKHLKEILMLSCIPPFLLSSTESGLTLEVKDQIELVRDLLLVAYNMGRVAYGKSIDEVVGAMLRDERDRCAQAVKDLGFETEAEAGSAYFDGTIDRAIMKGAGQ